MFHKKSQFFGLSLLGYGYYDKVEKGSTGFKMVFRPCNFKIDSEKWHLV